MRLGISTYSFPWAIGIKDSYPASPLTATGLLQYAFSKNIRLVQFGDNYPLHQLPADELTDLKKLAGDLNIDIQVGTRRLTVENLQRYLKIAYFFRSGFLRIVIDDDNYQPGIVEVIKTIQEIIPDLQKKELRLAIENHDRFPAAVLKHIVESTDRQSVGICLDTANSLGAGEGLHEVLTILGPYAINLHIKDIFIKRLNHKMGFRISGCTAGEGMIDIPALITEISRYASCDSAILEVWSDPQVTIEDTLRKEEEMVKKSIQYLKTIIS